MGTIFAIHTTAWVYVNLANLYGYRRELPDRWDGFYPITFYTVQLAVEGVRMLAQCLQSTLTEQVLQTHIISQALTMGPALRQLVGWAIPCMGRQVVV